MKRLFLLPTLLLLALFLNPTFAAPKAKHPAGPPPQKIVQVDARSITVALGKSGDEHESFNITDKTVVTIDGAPANARDLLAGMVAHIETGSDHTTATAIHASDPPSRPGKHRAG